MSMLPREMIFQWFQVSGFRCQHLAPLFPDTRHLTPET
ncbi:hypothetical protein D1AOALGA4SA_10683 [Olavius algarvensis Delta 1 endosymbiont]|nr:hypothetical protein D1AOALGA4SA_10683 [Olavius algarvensis Delta 1 endosymbiont]